MAGTQPPDVTELWDWTLGPGESHASPAHAAGTRELLLVLDGQVEVRVGPHAEVLATGDSASFAGDLPHGYVNADPQVARFALTVFEPGVSRDHDRRLPMADAGMLQEFLADACVDAAVFALRPDYRVLLLAVDGLVPGPGDQDSDALLAAAEAAAREALDGGPAEQLLHVAAWREAYRAFGAKPQRTRNSLEALLRRAGPGCPG